MAMNYKMDKFTQANGTIKIILRKAMEYRCGQMAQNMKDFGKIIKLLDLEDLF
jgi:hypothetical protein